MMTRYHVFLGAPSSKDIYQDIDDTARTYRWNTVTFPKSPPVLPSGTMEAVSRRISMLYENIIFDDEDHDGADYSAVPEHDEVNDDAGKLCIRPPLLRNILNKANYPRKDDVYHLAC